MPIVSIISPIYKVEDYLNECVESILSQSYEDFELILVDDGSPDNCPTICDKWAEKDSRIKVIHKENGGVSSARNVAIEQAQGDWIWFVDSDDMIEASSLSQLVALAQKQPDMIVFNKEINEEYKKDNRFFDEYYFKYRFGFEAWNKLYKASIIQENHLKFDTGETIGEDLLFNITYYQFAEKYLFSDLTLYNYRVREDSAMGAADPERLQKQLRVYSKIYDIYQNKLEQRILAQLFIMHLISGINQMDKAELCSDENCRLLQSSLKKYSFEKRAFQQAVNRFLESENASVAGRMRMKLFFGLLSKNVKMALSMMK
ncbi:MAG: glycosyltransferase family 2 protein [Clostridia bacterium]|nr:glycosyltransferase family 2 protein [Clostridia bacterium]